MEIRNLEQLQSDAKAGLLPALKKLPFLTLEDSPFIKGWAHILAAYPKLGKTELLTALTGCWIDEKILWLTEESVEVWGDRTKVRPQLEGKHVDLAFAFGEDPNDMQDTIYSSEATVIIIDTIRMLGVEDENNNAAVARALTPYIKLAREKNQTLILVHHTRKLEGAYGSAISGGHAYAGIVDVLIELNRLPRGPENRRQVTSLGRITSAPDILYEMVDGKISLLGTAKELGKYPNLGTVLAVTDHTWRTVEDLRDLLPSPKLSKSTVLRSLNKLMEDGSVERDPEVLEGGDTSYWRQA